MCPVTPAPPGGGRAGSCASGFGKRREPCDPCRGCLLYISVTHLVTVQRDITERKNTELAIKLSEERFRLVSNASNAVIWDYNLLTDTIWYNANLEKQFGHSTSEKYLPGTFWDDRVHPEDRKRVVASLNGGNARNKACLLYTSRCV